MIRLHGSVLQTMKPILCAAIALLSMDICLTCLTCMRYQSQGLLSLLMHSKLAYALGRRFPKCNLQYFRLHSPAFRCTRARTKRTCLWKYLALHNSLIYIRPVWEAGVNATTVLECRYHLFLIHLAICVAYLDLKSAVHYFCRSATLIFVTLFLLFCWFVFSHFLFHSTLRTMPYTSPTKKHALWSYGRLG